MEYIHLHGIIVSPKPFDGTHAPPYWTHLILGGTGCTKPVPYLNTQDQATYHQTYFIYNNPTNIHTYIHSLIPMDG
jgi:hypothetical protein